MRQVLLASRWARRPKGAAQATERSQLSVASWKPFYRSYVNPTIAEICQFIFNGWGKPGSVAIQDRWDH
jgi:hypothetical protein